MKYEIIYYKVQYQCLMHVSLLNITLLLLFNGDWGFSRTDYIKYYNYLCYLFGLDYLSLQQLIFNKYKTFFVLIYSYINTSGNWENEKLCGNTTPEGRRLSHNFEFSQFPRVLI